MSKNISSSAERYTFQLNNYIKRKQESMEEVSKDYIDMFEESIARHKSKFENSEEQKNNLEYDLRTTDWILSKVRGSDVYAQHLYAAMCNNDFQKISLENSAENMVDILKDGLPVWSCSWRYAGGIVADMREQGDYIDWYCSGIRDAVIPSEQDWKLLSQEQQDQWTNVQSKYVGEQTVTDEIRADLLKLGWRVIDCDDTTI